MGWFRLPFLMTKQSLFVRDVLLYGFTASNLKSQSYCVKELLKSMLCKKHEHQTFLQLALAPPTSGTHFRRNKRYISFGNFFSKIKGDDFPFSSKFSSDKPLTCYNNQETTEEDKPTDNRAPKLMKYSRCQYRQICNFLFSWNWDLDILSFCVLKLFGDCLETWKEFVCVRNNVNQPKKTTGKAEGKQNTDFQYLIFQFFIFSFFVFMELSTSSELNIG